MTKHISIGIEITAHITAIFFFLVKNISVSIWVSNILPHHVPTKECTLFYILLLKHFLISSQVINFAITRVKATITNDPLCSTLSREEPCEALEKIVCLLDYIPMEAEHSSGWESGIWDLRRQIQFSVVFLRRCK